MGETKKYWDHRDCRWVGYVPPADEVSVPAQAQPAEDRVVADPAAEVDVLLRAE